MGPTAAMFYLLGVMAIASALVLIFSRHPVYSVLALIFTMFCLAGEYILLNAQFLAVVHIIVYAGAIMVLFLFVLMLLNLNKDTEPQKSTLFKFIGVVASGLMIVTMAGATHGVNDLAEPGQVVEGLGLVKNLGRVLFTDFVIPFEISSILFLAAMVGAVMVGKREPVDNNINL
ncbi:MAG TPA: NADH-quinone oxidoreductase subunit J [Saprospiraceae bacterium]|nr:NADH-quinone oxidoreductase subunit J [Saprospiraceae bacterium]HQW55345.1 NADH-quinone oxidoreductase subunit J [Saprospiraceae bacterium]